MPRYHKTDNKLVFIQWQDKIQPGNYVVKTGDIDPVTRVRAKILFMPVNDMITLVRRGDYSRLAQKCGSKVRMLELDEVPDRIKKVFDVRQAKSAAAKSAAKEPPKQKAKPKSKKKGG